MTRSRHLRSARSIAVGLVAAGAGLGAATASAAAPAYDVPTGAQPFAAVTAENAPNPTELASVLDMAETTPDAGVPRCLGAASFGHTAWAWVAPDERPRVVHVSATPAAPSTDVVTTVAPDLALFVQPAGGTPQSADASEPQLCDGRELLGDAARGDANPEVVAVLPAGRPALVQVGWRAGEPRPQVVANLNAVRIDALPAPAGDDPQDAPALPAGGDADVPLAGATLGQGDPAEPFCQARATVWRRASVPGPGDYVATADGSATTLTAFAGTVSGDSALGCVDVGDGQGLRLVFRAASAGTVWLRVGVDDPTGAAGTRLTVRTSPAKGLPSRGQGAGGGDDPVAVARASDALLQCTTRRLVLTDARTVGGRSVRVTGVAGTANAGRRVSLRRVGRRSAVATAKVAADGTFTRTFVARGAARGSSARYRATLGSAAAVAVPLHPRFAVTSARRSGTTRVALKARLSKPLSGRRAVRLQTATCARGRARWRTVRTVRRSRTGAVVASIARPAGARVVIVRATGSVRTTAKRPRTASVSTLPQAVGF